MIESINDFLSFVVMFVALWVSGYGLFLVLRQERHRRNLDSEQEYYSLLGGMSDERRNKEEE